MPRGIKTKNQKNWRKKMKTMIKLVMVMALFCGSVMADGDQPNGGRTDCTVNCPPPCTENCGSAAGDDSDANSVGESEFEWISTDLFVTFANEIYRLYL
jgi:hypothetical protein